LSTVATQAAAALANARFFSMVERAKLQWETAFDALSEGIAVVDDEGRMRRVNRALADLLGRPIPQVLGGHLCHALLGRSLALMQLLEQARRGERPPPLVGRSEITGRTFRITAAPIQPASAGQTVVVLVEDVTDEQALEAQLIQSEKLAAVGQLVSGVAHELNNPLTSITGLSEFLLEQTPAGSREREHLQVVHEQAERAGRIVRNLLTFARKGATERTRVDLNDVVQRTVLLISYDLRLKDIAVRTDLAARLPDVLGERHALQQVVLNLLTNAAQAVETNPPAVPRDIVVTTWADDRVHLRVRDTGPGITDHVLPQLFTPFFTTKEPGQGTGLGLSISYSIVQGHGGTIAVERPADGGTAFHVDLPRAAADAPARSSGSRPPLSTPAPGAPGAPRSILLVDDDPAVRRVVEALFAQDGHTVQVADAADALELAAGGAWDLVIAGGLALAGGRLFVEELLERNPAVRDRVLVVTGDVRPAAAEALARLGLPYVRKPFNLRELRAAAARVWTAASAL
ncbi:MAG: ATP-binding protein, partial [Gemmatimonadales bacterium]